MRCPLLLTLLAACSGSEPAGGELIPAFVSIHASDDYACGLAAELGIGELPQHSPPYLAFSPARITRTRATE